MRCASVRRERALRQTAIPDNCRYEIVQRCFAHAAVQVAREDRGENTCRSVWHLRCEVRCYRIDVSMSFDEKFIVRFSAKGRQAGVLAQGGAQQPFRTHLELFRHSPGSNDFVRMLDAGAVVLLGEELMLRAQVKSGDGT